MNVTYVTSIFNNIEKREGTRIYTYKYRYISILIYIGWMDGWMDGWMNVWTKRERKERQVERELDMINKYNQARSTSLNKQIDWASNRLIRQVKS